MAADYRIQRLHGCQRPLSQGYKGKALNRRYITGFTAGVAAAVAIYAWIYFHAIQN